jgi:ribokinase
MRVLNIGSLNIDDIFAVERFVRPGETLGCLSYDRIPGGKGSNQSLALGRAGARVWHAGKIGSDGAFLRGLLEDSGVDCSLLRESSVPTGRAIIQVDADGQNCIILFGGANHDIGPEDIDAFLEGWGPGDALLLQNETSCLDRAFVEGARRGMRIFFNASPVKDNLRALPLELASCLLVNEVEGEALTGEREPHMMLKALRCRCPSTDIVLTLGAEGLRYSGSDGLELALDAERVPIVDTTAAGDTFTGFYIAALVRGEGAEAALREGNRTAAICVSRQGASSSIPWRRELV